MLRFKELDGRRQSSGVPHLERDQTIPGKVLPDQVDVARVVLHEEDAKRLTHFLAPFGGSITMLSQKLWIDLTTCMNWSRFMGLVM